jgi:hypothetical protein
MHMFNDGESGGAGREAKDKGGRARVLAEKEAVPQRVVRQRDAEGARGGRLTARREGIIDLRKVRIRRVG